MNHFFDRLIHRHIEPDTNIKPLIPGRFDHFPLSAKMKTNDPEKTEENKSEQLQPDLFIYPKKFSDANIPDNKNETVNFINTEQKKFQPFIDTVSGPVGITANSATIENNINETLDRDQIKVHSPGSKEKTNEGSANEIKNIRPSSHTGSLKKIYVETNVAKTKEEEQLSDDKAKKEKPINESLPVLQKSNLRPVEDETRPEVFHNNEQIISSFISTKRKAEYPFKEPSSKKTSTRSIHISIDRIEIKAQFPKQETKIITKKEDTGIMSLEQYLEQRKSR